ncbi:MAG: metal-dependent hydrolase [Thermoleophilia bacterium]
MSWAAHDLEPYLIRFKLGAAISIPFCILGSYSPDIATKWAVYGLDFSGGHELVSDPVHFHRGWVGVGFTHTLMFGVVMGLIILALTRSRMWALSFLIGNWAHVLSDTLDSVGVMVAFPFTQWHMHFGVWEYVGEAGRRVDAIAYYTSLGGVWDTLWALWLLWNWRILTTEFFRREVYPKDPFWGWLNRLIPETGLLTLYRASAFFGIASIMGWYAWALAVNNFHASLDWSIGGPQWTPRIGPR